MKSEGLGQGLGGANYQYEKSGWDEWRDANCIVGLSKEAKKCKRDREIYLEIGGNLYVYYKQLQDLRSIYGN